MKKNDNNKPDNDHFSGYVIGIAASAGGLEALEKFFDACPIDTGAAFVVIQHLLADHKSIMDNLLARHTQMPVTMVEQDTFIEGNHVYLIPPGSVMYMGKGFLYLTPKKPYGLTLPVDIFFNSLAESYGNHAIGIILSGTGSDGTRGASAINSRGGFLLAQDPSTASFEGMPQSFINTGLVDEILPPEELSSRVVAHIKHSVSTESHAYMKKDGYIPRPALSPEEALNGIMQLMLQISGIDFREYKLTTIMRRLKRRMQVGRIFSLNDYLTLLESDSSEAMTLRQEFLISVTGFLRDSEPFKTLIDSAIVEIVANKKNGDTVRVWSAGCSTGEEAYTLGILFLEEIERQNLDLNLKIFATDVNQLNIEFAAVGSYSESAAAELSPERLEKFFNVRGANFVVSNELRQCLVFARHNLLTDPPFTKIDLVVCRNTLIYFKNTAQERVLHRLLYAVSPNGFLFLGSSESLLPAHEGFKVVSSKHKLFKRVSTVANAHYDILQNIGPAYQAERRKAALVTGRKSKINDNSAIDDAIGLLLSTYAPPALLVNGNHEVLHLFGAVPPYLAFHEGSASLQIRRVLVPRLIPIASALLYKAEKTNTTLVSDFIQFKYPDESTHLLRLSARPVPIRTHEQLMLLCFETQQELIETQETPFNIGSETLERLEVLETELAATRESLQATIEELEVSNEELQATNEESLASNEELQSSNEELQSVNEELNAVNAEYQEKAMILSQLNADLDSMAKASGVATIFVDEHLVLTRFSQDAIQIFKLRNSDIGRRLDDFAHNLKDCNLIENIERTLRLQRMTEREVLSNDGRTFLMRVLPYFVPSTKKQGAVASFVDITAFLDVKRLQAILDALPEQISVLERDGTVAFVNEARQSFTQKNCNIGFDSAIGKDYFEICRINTLEDREITQQATDGIKSVLNGSKPFFSLQYPYHSATKQYWFAMNVAPVKNYDYGVVVSHIDISPWHINKKPEDGKSE